MKIPHHYRTVIEDGKINLLYGEDFDAYQYSISLFDWGHRVLRSRDLDFRKITDKEKEELQDAWFFKERNYKLQHETMQLSTWVKEYIDCLRTVW